MAAVGGPIREVSLDGRIYQCTSEATATIKPGIASNEVKVSGAGVPYLLQKAEPSEVDGLVLLIDNNQESMRHLDGLAAKGDFWPATITLADGRTYQGSQMQLAEKPAFNTSEGTATVKLAGGPMELQ
jgi:hypothetical protein